MSNSDMGAVAGASDSSATSNSAQDFSIAGKRVTIMGLGLHGGGRASSEYCLRRGTRLCITDLRSEALLGKSITGIRRSFPNSDVSFVLGRHEDENFSNADVIIKNPAVRRNSPYLRRAQEAGVRIETDISLFLSELAGSALRGKANCTIIAVTGTKGKSTGCATIHHVLSEQARRNSQTQAVFLGGNITTSPLTFLPAMQEALMAGRRVYVILELSSFQIGDLKMVIQSRRAKGISEAMHWPDYALLTNILPDHLDYYTRMQDYVNDKAYLFTRGQGVRIIGDAGDWTESFLRASDSGDVHTQPIDSAVQSPARSSAPARATDDNAPARSSAPIISQNPVRNLLALLAPEIGCTQNDIEDRLQTFRGIQHRFEYIGRWLLPAEELFKRTPLENAEQLGRSPQTVPVDIYNDSAATIPESCLRAVQGLKLARVYLICGGAEKNLKLDLLIRALALSTRFYLLAGSASSEIENLLGVNLRSKTRADTEVGARVEALTISRQIGEKYSGTFGSMAEVVRSAYEDIRNDSVECTGAFNSTESTESAESSTLLALPRFVLLLSPGTSSFGIFQNEFDRGRQFVGAVQEVAKVHPA